MNQLVTTVLAVLGVTAASTLAVLDEVPLLTDVMIGAGAGVIVGKLLTHRLERRHGELSSARVRQIEWAWTAARVGGALLVNAAFRLAQGVS
ncbi:MAG: hypothetical protein M3433_02900 [Actinomycetota bacterium]|nr:hypothetical protein [Actinomycetota bacterium]